MDTEIVLINAKVKEFFSHIGDLFLQAQDPDAGTCCIFSVIFPNQQQFFFQIFVPLYKSKIHKLASPTSDS